MTNNPELCYWPVCINENWRSCIGAEGKTERDISGQKRDELKLWKGGRNIDLHNLFNFPVLTVSRFPFRQHDFSVATPLQVTFLPSSFAFKRRTAQQIWNLRGWSELSLRKIVSITFARAEQFEMCRSLIFNLLEGNIFKGYVLPAQWEEWTSSENFRICVRRKHYLQALLITILYKIWCTYS